jgi:hypothetical protein
MQDQPKAITYRPNTFYKDGTGSRPLVEGTVPRGYLRDNREFFFGKKLNASDLNQEQQAQRQNPQQPGNSTAHLRMMSIRFRCRLQKLILIAGKNASTFTAQSVTA